MSPGDKVICVDASKQPHTVEELNQDISHWVVKGNTYTIREIVDYDFVVAVLLGEIVNPPKYFKVLNRVMEPAFKIDRFRKIQGAAVEENVKEESYV